MRWHGQVVFVIVAVKGIDTLALAAVGVMFKVTPSWKVAVLPLNGPIVNVRVLPLTVGPVRMLAPLRFATEAVVSDRLALVDGLAVPIVTVIVNVRPELVQDCPWPVPLEQLNVIVGVVTEPDERRMALPLVRVTVPVAAATVKADDWLPRTKRPIAGAFEDGDTAIPTDRFCAASALWLSASSATAPAHARPVREASASAARELTSCRPASRGST